MTDAQVPVSFVMERFREVQDGLVRLDEKLDHTIGDYSVRLAKLELRADQLDLRMERAIGTRRWLVGMLLSSLAVLVAVAAILIPLLVKG